MKTIAQTGIIQILLSGFCFGFLGIFGKTAYEQGITPGELLSLRFLVGGLILLLFLFFTNRSSLLAPGRQLFAFAGLGVGGYAVFSSCYFTALQGLSASLTVLLLYTYPIIVSVGAWILFGEKIPKNRWLAIPLVCVGLLLLVWGEFQVENRVSLLYGIGSAVFYSAYILASSRLLKGVSPWVAVTYIQLFAGVALALLHFRNSERMIDLVINNWVVIISMALICSVIAMSLFLSGLQKLKNWEASILSTAEPITGIFLAAVLLGERLVASQWIGALAVIIAFIQISLPGVRDNIIRKGVV